MSGAGQTAPPHTAYQIWGWGASNLVLALGWVRSRFDYWPFWLPQLVIGLPLLLALLGRQARENTAAARVLELWAVPAGILFRLAISQRELSRLSPGLSGDRRAG